MSDHAERQQMARDIWGLVREERRHAYLEVAKECERRISEIDEEQAERNAFRAANPDRDFDATDADAADDQARRRLVHGLRSLAAWARGRAGQ